MMGAEATSPCVFEACQKLNLNIPTKGYWNQRLNYIMEHKTASFVLDIDEIYKCINGTTPIYVEVDSA